MTIRYTCSEYNLQQHGNSRMSNERNFFTLRTTLGLRIASGRVFVMAIAMLFSLSAIAYCASKEKLLHVFGQGDLPWAGVTFDSAGNLNGCGTVFKLTPNEDGSWKETILHAMHKGGGVSPDGQNPRFHSGKLASKELSSAYSVPTSQQPELLISDLCSRNNDRCQNR